MIKKNQFMRKALSMMLILVMIFAPSINVYANNEPVSSSNNFDSVELIVGNADKQQEVRIPNWLNIDWDATASKIFIYVRNVGIDTVDIFSGTVTVENGTPIPFTALNIAPMENRTITVSVNMKKCYEDIIVKYYGVDGGTEFAEGASPGHRERPSNLSSLWTKGNSAAVYKAIEQHFTKHGSEVSIKYS